MVKDFVGGFFVVFFFIRFHSLSIHVIRIHYRIFISIHIMNLSRYKGRKYSFFICFKFKSISAVCLFFFFFFFFFALFIVLGFVLLFNCIDLLAFKVGFLGSASRISEAPMARHFWSLLDRQLFSRESRFRQLGSF